MATKTETAEPEVEDNNDEEKEDFYRFIPENEQQAHHLIIPTKIRILNEHECRFYNRTGEVVVDSARITVTQWCVTCGSKRLIEIQTPEL